LLYLLKETAARYKNPQWFVKGRHGLHPIQQQETKDCLVTRPAFTLVLLCFRAAMTGLLAAHAQQL
jgi:hypothetical protein